MLRTASFVARYCFRNASFSVASLARADLVCALACTATELEGFRRFLTSEGVGPPSSSSSSCCAVVVEVGFFDLTLGSRASSLPCPCSASSSSSPNESPIFFTPFFRFLKPAGLGVCSLYLVRQFLFFDATRYDATRAQNEKLTDSQSLACSHHFHYQHRRSAQALRRVACGNPKGVPGRLSAL